jgi:hypothetical protein
MPIFPALSRIDLRACPDETRDELWRFVSRHEDLAFDDFCALARDLSDVYVCRHPSGAIGGVVAARILTVTEGARASTLVWGEWGFLEPSFRGGLVLERVMVRRVLKECLRHPLRPVYFMAEAATAKGYLALARGFARFWPKPGHPLPSPLRTLAERAVARAGERAYDAARGVFHRGKPIRGAAGARPSRRRTELLDFYTRMNPGERDGDTLLCVAEVSLANLILMPPRAFLAQAFGG